MTTDQKASGFTWAILDGQVEGYVTRGHRRHMERLEMTQREQCLATAQRVGWTVTPKPDVTVFEKGPRWLSVQFSERGTIVAASTPRRHIAGTGKLDKVLVELGG
ncbi:hypothetical protein CH253_08020 [Rhodococcus sp. 06-156-3C]|nr:hypothetical protein CH253_08020 [Rhodococcus sp. 06-156-3C]